MIERAAEMAPHARHEGEIARLVIAGGETREDSQDAHRVDGAKYGELALELSFARARRFEVCADRRLMRGGAHIAARVVQQHGEVPAAPAANGVLKVQQADALNAVALRQPEQVLGVIVADGESARKAERFDDQAV